LLGGLCGECTKDADCSNGGCTIPNPFKSLGSVCNMGEPGAGCESDEICSDAAPVCGTILDSPGLITVKTCGTCDENSDCGNDTPYCEPVIQLLDVSGQLTCVG